jgi:fatty-acyl-CoA synthase
MLLSQAAWRGGRSVALQDDHRRLGCLPKGLAAAALARGMDVFTGYGMSETCPILTIAHVPTAALPDADAQAAERDQDRLHHAAGRPAYRRRRDARCRARRQGNRRDRRPRPWLTQGYLHNPAASEELWAGGYLHTGDIGTIDRAAC